MSGAFLVPVYCPPRTTIDTNPKSLGEAKKQTREAVKRLVLGLINILGFFALAALAAF